MARCGSIPRLVLVTGLFLAWNSPAATAGSVSLPSGVGGTYSVPVTSVKEARFNTTLKQEYDFSCGSAALAALLTFHYQYQVSEQTVFQKMYNRGDQEKIRKVGFSLLDMKRFLESIGYQADGIRGSLSTLVDLGVPAIVLINDKGYRHFVVIKGVEADRVLIGDPATGMRALSRTDLESMWNGILFVIRDQTTVGRQFFNQEAEWRLTSGAPVEHVARQEGSPSAALLLAPASDF